jgi:hypothetical protein
VNWRAVSTDTHKTEGSLLFISFNDVAYWHKADVPIALSNVRFWVKSGLVTDSQNVRF